MIHLYCLAVQAGFYSDVVECSTLDRRVPGSILGWDMEIFLRVRDNGAQRGARMTHMCIRTP